MINSACDPAEIPGVLYRIAVQHGLGIAQL